MSCMLPMVFDPNSVAPATGGAGQLPVSDKNGHAVIITEGEMKPTQDNTGFLLALNLKIIDGPHADVEGVYRLNIGNTSAEAVRIAFSELSALFHVVGHLQPSQDVSVLYNKPFRVLVGLQEKAEAKAKGYTQITGVRDIQGRKPGEQMQGGGGPSPVAPGPAPQPQQPQQPQPQQQPVPPQQPAQQYVPAQQWPAQTPQLQPQVQSGIPMQGQPGQAAPWLQPKQ